MNKFCGTTQEKWNMWTRLIGAVLLLVATVCTVIYAIVLVWDSFEDKSVNLVIPIAYVTYSSVMAQVAFALLRQFRTLCSRVARWAGLAVGLFSAVVLVWDPVVDLSPLIDRPEFLIVIVTFTITVYNLALEGLPQPQDRTVAWMWERNPF